MIAVVRCAKAPRMIVGCKKRIDERAQKRPFMMVGEQRRGVIVSLIVCYGESAK
jgi:hypothetical protein